VSLYEFLLFAHITFVAVWVGGDVMLQALALRARAAGPQKMGELMSDIEWVGGRLLTPAALLVVVFGVWMVIDQPAWEFSQFWITAGLAVFLASFIAGAGFLGPGSGRIGAMIAERGSEDVEAQRRIRRILWISRVELVLLVAVILVMVVKPGL